MSRFVLISLSLGEGQAYPYSIEPRRNCIYVTLSIFLRIHHFYLELSTWICLSFARLLSCIATPGGDLRVEPGGFITLRAGKCQGILCIAQDDIHFLIARIAHKDSYADRASNLSLMAMILLYRIFWTRFAMRTAASPLGMFSIRK